MLKKQLVFFFLNIFTLRSIITIIIPCEFFTPALADGLLLESKGQRIFSSLQDSSQYSS